MIIKVIKKALKIATAPLRKIMGWLFKMPDMPDAAAVMVEKQGSDHPIPVVYGARKIGVIKVHKYVTDLSGGAQNELLHLICVLCEGEIDAIEEVFFDGVSENDQRWRKDKNNPNSAKWFTVHRYFGAANQPASAAAVSGIPNWTINHTLNGLAYLYVVLQMDKDQSIWRGEPEITARVRGRKVFDPRTNTTAFSTNPAIQLLDYLQNPIYGKGLNQNRLDLPSFIAAANFADETLNSTVIVNGTPTPFTHKRFTGNQVVDTGKSVFSNVQQMLSAMRGSLPIGSGVLRLQLERDTSPVFYFSHGRSDQLNHATITGRIKSSGGSKKDRFNRVVVRFPNAALDFERDEVFYPDSEDPQFTQWLAEDNGVLLEQNFEFNTITNKAEALQMARIIALRSRFQLQCSFTASPAAIVIEPGDVVAITDDTRGWDAKPFRAEQVKLRDDGDVELEFIEHQNAIYPWSGTTYEERTGGTNLGDPTNIPAPTGLSITPDLTLATGGRLTWSAANNAFIRRFRVQLQSGSTVLFSEETAGRSLDLPLLAPGNYSISVFAISTLNTLSPPAVIAYELTQPVPPASIQLTSFNFEIEARPVLAGAGLGTQFEFDCVEGDGSGHTPTSKARGATATFIGLKHDTLYTIFARTINALGNSDWVSASITTTNDANNVIDLIKDPLWESTFQPVVIDLQSEFNQAVQSARDDFDAGLNDARTQLESARSELNLAISETANTAAQELQDAQQQLAAAIQAAENTASSELAAARQQIDAAIELTANTAAQELQAAQQQIATAINEAESTAADNLASARQELAQSIASAESALNVKLASEVVSRQKTDMALFNAAAATLQFKQTVQAGITNLQDAVFEVDPANGQLRLRAFSYTDSAFTQAQLLIDGVNAGVNILAQRVSVNETGLVDANSEINALAGQIQLRATYTEVNQAIAGAIDAVLPAYSFGFFNSTEGWAALAGSITPANGKVQLVQGDITNQALSYIADENPIISISIERTGGTGWVGSIVVTFSDAPDQLYEAVIENVPAGTAFVRNLNLAGEASYSGQVTGLRFIFGSSDADAFTVNSITIGKPSATLTELEGLSAQVNQLGVDIDAVAGQLSSYVTTAFYNDNTVTLSNVEQVLDGTASVISLKATQQQINAAGTVDKANTAASWIDAAEANITQVVTAFVEQPGGVNDQLDETRQSLTNASTQINALAGRITDQIVSISAVRNKATDIAKLQFFAEHELYKQRNNLLDQGSSIALAQRDISAVTNAQQATAQELLQLSASFGAATGQFNADLQVLNTSLANETQARVSSLQQLDANLSGQINATATQLTQAIVTEQEARANAISQLSAQFTDDITATADSFTLALSDETAARVQQIGNLQTSFGQDIAAAESRVTTLVSNESQARANAISQLSAQFTDDITATADSFTLALSDETAARVQQIGNLQTSFGQDIAAAESRVTTLVSNESQARANAISQLSAQFTDDITATADSFTLALSDETAARVQQIGNLQTSFGQDIAAAETRVTNLVSNESQARANAISQLSAQFTDDITATADSFTLALSDETAARVQQIGNLQTSFGQDIAAAESRVTTLVSNESQARANAISQLSAQFTDDITATADSFTLALSDETAARVQQIGNLQTSFGQDIAAAESRVTTLVSNESQARANAITQLQAEFADNYATISSVQQTESKIDKVGARQQEQLLSIYGVKQKASGADKAAFYNAEALLKQRNNQLEQGNSIALAQRDLSAVSAAQQATAQELLQLSASFGAATGQFNADLQVLNTSLANETQARVSSLQQLDANLSGQINATATQLTQAIVTEQEARANAISQLSAQFTDDITATTDSFTLALSDETAARVQQIGNLQTSFGQDISAAETRVTNLVSNESQARANAISQLSTSFGDSLTATNQAVSQVNAKADSTAQALQGLSSQVTGLADDLSAAELLLESAVDELGQVSGRAFLGVTTTVGGKRNVTGIVFDGQENGIRLQGDIFELANTGGQPVVYWSDAGGVLNIRARLVLSGGETVDKIEDIRALDGNYTEYRYRTAASAPATPTGTNPSGWSTTPPNTTDPIWVSQAVKKADGSALIGSWSSPVRWNGTQGATGQQGPQGPQGPQGVPGAPGSPGAVGAGFYGSTYAAISWTTSTVNQRFTELTGRAPVVFDVFTQTRSDGTDSQARQYNGSSWGAVALQVNGSIVAKGTIAGDRFMAGTEITAPVIKGGEVIVADSAVEYMSVIRALPFGQANDLVEWFGPRINGVTWNNTTMLPIYSGMTKLNAKTYKTKSGGVFFGGTFQAGTLSISRQSTTASGSLAVSSDPFTIPGGATALSVTSSLSISGSQLGAGSCPANLPSFNLVVNIERLVNGTWQNIGGNNAIVAATCIQEGPEMIIELTGGVSVNTSLSVSAGQSVSLRATATAPAFPTEIGGLNLQGNRSLSLVISGV